MRTNDPRILIAQGPMRLRQIVAVMIAVGLNALDGFDVLSISFASPGIAKDWRIDRTALGIVLSMELIGMTIGSIFIGQLCDRVGRRRTVLGCLVLMAGGMALAATASDVIALSLWRLLTGLGIGGMLAATNVIVAEFASTRRKALAMSVMVMGHPLGAVVGGSIASVLLVHYNWHVVFVFGALLTASFIPLTLWLLPETPAWLICRRPPNAFARVNAVLVKLGHEPVDHLPDPEPEAPRVRLSKLFAPGLMPVTMVLTAAYFMHMMTFSFIIKWTPMVVADMGFAPSAAGGVLVWASLGGMGGSLIFGLLSLKTGVKRLTIGTMLLAVILVGLFGRSAPDLVDLSLLAAAASMCTNGAMVGIYTMLAQSFPTALRATGTGFAIGVGRSGAVISPIIAGALFQAGAGFPAVATAMGLASAVAAATLTRLRYGKTQAA